MKITIFNDRFLFVIFLLVSSAAIWCIASLGTLYSKRDHLMGIMGAQLVSMKFNQDSSETKAIGHNIALAAYNSINYAIASNWIVLSLLIASTISLIFKMTKPNSLTIDKNNTVEKGKS